MLFRCLRHIRKAWFYNNLDCKYGKYMKIYIFITVYNHLQFPQFWFLLNFGECKISNCWWIRVQNNEGRASFRGQYHDLLWPVNADLLLEMSELIRQREGRRKSLALYSICGPSSWFCWLAWWLRVGHDRATELTDDDWKFLPRLDVCNRNPWGRI